MKTALIALLFVLMAKVHGETWQYDDSVQDWRDDRITPIAQSNKDGEPATFFLSKEHNRMVVALPEGKPVNANEIEPGSYVGFTWTAPENERIVSVKFVYASVLKPGLVLSVWAEDKKLLSIEPSVAIDNRAESKWKLIEVKLPQEPVRELQFRLWAMPEENKPSASIGAGWFSSIVKLTVETTKER